ncbi:hypothetical protein D3C71_1723590 [compost metagenome]
MNPVRAACQHFAQLPVFKHFRVMEMVPKIALGKEVGIFALFILEGSGFHLRSLAVLNVVVREAGEEQESTGTELLQRGRDQNPPVAFKEQMQDIIAEYRII